MQECAVRSTLGVKRVHVFVRGWLGTLEGSKRAGRFEMTLGKDGSSCVMPQSKSNRHCSMFMATERVAEVIEPEKRDMR